MTNINNSISNETLHSLIDKPWVIKYLPDIVKNNLEAASVCLKSDGSTLVCFSEQIKNHKPSVMIAVQNDGMAIRYASDTLKQDYDIIIAAIQQNKEALGYIDPSMIDEFAIYAEQYHKDIKKQKISLPNNDLAIKKIKNIL